MLIREFHFSLKQKVFHNFYSLFHLASKAAGENLFECEKLLFMCGVGKNGWNENLLLSLSVHQQVNRTKMKFKQREVDVEFVAFR